MESLETQVITNLYLVFDYYDLESTHDISNYINVNNSTLKSWQSHERTPTLKTLDNICNKLFIPTYTLFLRTISEDDISNFIDPTIQNNSPDILRANFKNIYRDKGMDSWDEIEALLYGLLSKETLKSYHRSKDPIVPPISTLEKISTYLGIPPDKLLRRN